MINFGVVRYLRIVSRTDHPFDISTSISSKTKTKNFLPRISKAMSTNSWKLLSKSYADFTLFNPRSTMYKSSSQFSYCFLFSPSSVGKPLAKELNLLLHSFSKQQQLALLSFL